MSRDLGMGPGAPLPPPAIRTTRPGWRDPRLWLGVLLVAGSVVVGARVLAAADDTVAVWAVVGEHGAGAVLSGDDVVVQRVRFADGGVLDRYFTADEALPDDLVLHRPVGSGELLARAAVGPASATQTLQVPLEVDPNRVPPDVAEGSVVDVWVSDAAAVVEVGEEPGAGEGAGEGDDAAPALAEVTVIAAPAFDDTFAVTGARQLVVAVDDDRAAAFERLLGSLQEPVIRILQRS